MKRPLLMLMTIMFFALPVLGNAQFGTFAGSVVVDSVEVEPGSSFAVTVRLTGNDLAIGAMQLPLKFTSPHLFLDSVSFAGSIKPAGTNGTSQIDNVNDLTTLHYYPNYNIFPVATTSASEGILGTLYFTVSSLAPIGTIMIDSVYHGASTDIWSGIGFADAAGNELKLPSSFTPGKIMVRMPTAVDDLSGEQSLPTVFEMAQNFPNPFNPTTVIDFTLPMSGHVMLEVYNVLGQKTATLLDKTMSAGFHQVEFDAGSSPSGIYFYRLSSQGKSLTRKMILIK